MRGVLPSSPSESAVPVGFEKNAGYSGGTAPSSGGLRSCRPQAESWVGPALLRPACRPWARPALGNWARGDLGKQSPWSPSFHPLGLLPVASPADSPASCCQACRHEHPERLLPLPRVTGNLKGTFDLLVAFETLRRPCQCNPWLACLRAKSQHPGGPGAGRARVVWGRLPGAFGHRSLACAFQPTVRLLGALPRHTVQAMAQGMVVRRQSGLGNRHGSVLPLSQCDFHGGCLVGGNGGGGGGYVCGCCQAPRHGWSLQARGCARTPHLCPAQS